MDPDRAFDAIDGFVTAVRNAVTVPGLALSVTSRAETLGVRTYGLADVERGEPVTPGTLFEIGSIGKAFTACCALRLVEEGRLDLHAPVTEYLPWFAVRSAFAEPIALHHLLSHTAGLIEGSDVTSNSLFDVWALRDIEAGSAPGSRFHYSNVGYRVVGAVLEAVEGRSYPEILRERVLSPLGMDASEPAITNAARARLAMGYDQWPDDRPVLPSDPLRPATWLETATADGSVASTAEDMASFLRMLMRGGEGPSGHLLSRESVELMCAPAARLDDERSYGYAILRWNTGGRTFLGHGGDMVGFVAKMRWDPEAGVGAVALVNGLDWFDLTEDVVRHAIRVVAAGVRGEAVPVPPEPVDPAHVPSATAYAGTYLKDMRRIDVEADGDRLTVVANGRREPLGRCAGDTFVVRHPELDDRFALHFERDEAGNVVAACNGPARYLPVSATADQPATDPSWRAFEGHYECYNPWRPHVRVILRGARLHLCDRWGGEEPLVPTGGAGAFRVGDDEHTPECIRFDTVVDGAALRANLSGCDYYRSFSP